MVVVVIVLAVLAAVAIALAVVAWARLREQRRLTDGVSTTLAETVAERDAATARATDAEAARDAASADANEARGEAERAKADADVLRAAKSGVDPELLWTLEQARTERTWRQSVAVGGETASVLEGAAEPLREALQVELDAAREDVGAVVELDAELPPTLSAAASLLVLRSAQELLAHAIKTAEETTLRVRTDGDDVVVTVLATDEDGQPVVMEPPTIPESPDMAPAEGGVRIRGAVASPD